jgi:23S rRNA (adenine2503-C2)-methyltransferase
MRIVSSAGRTDVATVFIADMGDGRLVEFVESTQPPLTRDEKWVLIVSVLYGCPIGCLMCDAGDAYRGRLTVEELFAQIDFLIRGRFPDGEVPVPRFKIQFARMGEPAMNPAVLDVLREMPRRYVLRGFVPSLSTVAPRGCDGFFEALREIKDELYPHGFQLQFSIHSSDPAARDRIIPAPKWSFEEIAAYGERFRNGDGKKVSLNFALARGVPVEPDALLRHFSPDSFLLKITPVNPTYRARENRLESFLDPQRQDRAADDEVVGGLRAAGYEVIVSIGEPEENQIGSNCGQFVLRHLEHEDARSGEGAPGYSYWCGALNEAEDGERSVRGG